MTSVRRFALATAVASLLFAAPAWAQSADAEKCDELAASRYDLETPAGQGVTFNQLDAAAAIAACTAAVAAAPDDGKRRYQLGRALDKAGRGPEALAAFDEAAADGSVIALSGAGTLYDGGYGIPQDEAKALDYYQRAADKGLPLAMVNIGVMYENGYGVAQDYAKAFEFYKRATDLGSPYAAATLGLLYERGRGVDKDMAEAVRLYRIGADAGEDFALRNLGIAYELGLGGLARDEKEAYRLYMASAAMKFPEAYISVGEALHHGRGVPANSDAAETYFRMAILEGTATVKAGGQNSVAWLYATENRKLDEAEALSREAVASAPENGNFLDTLAWILHLQGRDAEALPLAEKALQLAPDDADIAAHLATLKG